MNATKTNRHDKKSSNSDQRETVQVFCRLRPLQDESELPSIKLISATTLATSTELKSKSVRRDCNYVFRHVFTSYSTQRQVFEQIALPLLEDLVHGKNGLLFTYGVTGSGKTFTLTGDLVNPGIMPTCIYTLFNSIGDKQAQKYLIKSDRMNGFEMQSESEAREEKLQETRLYNKRVRNLKKASRDKIMYENEGIKLSNVNSNSLYTVFISYTEIYNNSVYDLLDDTNSKFVQTKIIREDPQKNMYVNGVEEVEVKSAEEAFELFYLGQKKKRMAYTLLNAESSRSHSIFNIRIVQLIKNMEGTEIPTHTNMTIGQLSLVDLAGSERSNRTNNTGIRLKEASSINNSLMTLRCCLEILRDNQISGSNKVVPYRDSRLTLLFKNYFDGEGEVRMVVCINPSEKDFEENLQVLKFAETTQEVQVTKAESRFVKQFKTPLNSAIPTPRIKSTKSTPSSLLPKIPSNQLLLKDSATINTQVEKIIKCLKVRKQRGLLQKQETAQSYNAFRKRLSSVKDEDVLSKSEVRNLKTLLKKEKHITQNHDAKISELESNHIALTTQNKELQETIQRLQLAIAEKELKLNQDRLERENHKHKLAKCQAKLSKEFDDKLREQMHQLENEMHTKELKLKKIKGIMCSGNNQESATHKTFLHTPSRLRPDEVWIEHNSVKPIGLTTVLQPSMRKRKIVDKLQNATDITNAKQSKYCLIAQETDNAGDLETKFYKGDIIRTCGGRAQVILNGIECLREESPLSPTN